MPGNNAPLILIFFSFQIIIHLSSHKFLISLFYVLMMNSDPFFLFLFFEFKPF